MTAVILWRKAEAALLQADFWCQHHKTTPVCFTASPEASSSLRLIRIRTNLDQTGSAELFQMIFLLSVFETSQWKFWHHQSVNELQLRLISAPLLGFQLPDLHFMHSVCSEFLFVGICQVNHVDVGFFNFSALNMFFLICSGWIYGFPEQNNEKTMFTVHSVLSSIFFMLNFNHVVYKFDFFFAVFPVCSVFGKS